MSASEESEAGPSDGPKRWNKGRSWDGVGAWCDPLTAEDACRDTLAFQEPPEVTIYQVMELMSKTFADKRVYTYLDGKGKEIENQSLAEILLYAQRIGAYMQREMGLRPGDRAVLLYPPGPEFILAFIACLYSGVIAVPVYPPHPYRFDTEVPRLNGIVKNSGCQVALVDSQYNIVIRGVAIKNMFSRVGLATAVQWPNLRNVLTDKVRRSYAHTTLLEEPNSQPDDLAFLQYTSGSTSDPKGVMVTHGNLKAQMSLLCQQAIDTLGYTNQNTTVAWLPQYHDMGLIGIFLLHAVTAAHVVYTTPISFIQDPTVWLTAVSKYRAAATAAPNFAFALAHRKTTPALRDSYDLTNLQAVICGAEPIRAESMKGFFEYFAPCGFNPLSFNPSYGLAEFTLCATSQGTGKPMNILYVDQRVLQNEGKVQLVEKNAPGSSCYVGLGVVRDQWSVVRIVDPDSCECLGQGRVGEVWLDGPSKAKGYFDDPERTAKAFNGIIKGEEDSGRIYLQTGDQGFLWEGQLFLTGRIKDLIIINGRNLYPQDLEYAIEQQVEDVLRPGCSSAFAYDHNGMETVVYVVELREMVKDRAILQNAVEQIRRVVATEFEVVVSGVVLVAPRSIPKTTSGKMQRYKAREKFIDGTLKEVHRWVIWSTDESAPSSEGLEAPVEDQVEFFECDEPSDDLYLHEHGPSFDSKGVGEEVELLSRTGSSCTSHKHADESLSSGSQAELSDGSSQEEIDDPELRARTSDFIERMVSYVAEAKQMPRGSIDIDQPMALFGFDSSGFVMLGKVMGDWVGKELSPVIVYKYTTIREVAGFLARGANEAELSAVPADDKLEADLDAPIAIVGIGLKAPGGAQGNLVGKDAFWKFVLAGGDGVREDMPAERKADAKSKLPGAYIDGVDAFDAAFFGIHPAEASHLDYQQSQVLETTWHALEDAGLDPTSLAERRVGVYVGAISHEFAVLEAFRHEPSTYAATGVSTSLVANRVSYVLGLRGPSVVVDTACSSSLVAVHDAVRDLRLGACSMALAGGVNLVLNSEASESLRRAGFLSTACRTFDASGDGYCRGEGCGMVVLKRLSHALAEGDRVYAVIRGSAVGHDGRTTTVTAPNPTAQESVIRTALRDAKVEASQVRYIEAHGTGTKLGDSIEMSALGAVMRARALENKCIIASAKSNIGHLEAAAGVMGLIRTTLILHHGVVPRAVHFETPNPHIPWDRLPFEVPRENTPLLADDPEAGGLTVLAGVSSFGFGGTNSHVILESVPRAFDAFDDFETTQEEEQGGEIRRPLLLPLSAKSDGALRRLAQAYSDLLSPTTKGPCGYDRAMQLCLDAGTRRVHQSGHRFAAVGRSASELKQSIETQLLQPTLEPVGPVPQVAFLFTGQGAGYMGMGRALYERNAVFSAHVQECDALMAPLLGGLSILEEVILAPVDQHGAPLSRTLLAQPSLFALQYALSRVWALMGVEPSVLMGHSAGEVVAAVVAGCLTLQDGVRIICARAKAMDALPAGEGGMTVVYDSEEAIQELLSTIDCTPPLEIACINGPSCVTVSGCLPGLSALHAQLSDRALRFTKLSVSHAFHSPAMDGALDAVREACVGIVASPPRKASLISLTTGRALRIAPDAEHWAKNVRQAVRFHDGLRTLTHGNKPMVIIELGPDAALTAMARRAIPTEDQSHLRLIATMTKRRRDDEGLGLVEAMSAAYAAGITLKFQSLRIAPSDASGLELPLYPFEPLVHAPLARLTSTALALLNATPSSAKPQAAVDYGTTYMLEEYWLPRKEEPEGVGLPPIEAIFVCSEAIDAAAIAATKPPGKETVHRVVVPASIEAETRALLQAYGARGDMVTVVDFMAEDEDAIIKAIRGMPEADSVAIIFVASAKAGAIHDLEAAEDRTFDESARLLLIFKAMAALSLGSRLKLWLVTTRAKAVVEGDRVENLGGALWTMAKCIINECAPQVWATMTDLPGPSSRQPGLVPSSLQDVHQKREVRAAAARFLSFMSTQLRAGGTRDSPDQLAYRDGQWLVMRLRQSWLEEELDQQALAAGMESDDFPPQGMELRTVQTLATAPNLGYKDGCHSVTATPTDTPEGASTPRSAFSPRSDDSALASPAPSTPLASLHSPGDHFTPVNVGPEGWYLITGGVSGLGLQTALALVRHGARRLILTSRGGTIPERYQEDYDALLSMSPDLDVRVEACDAGSLDSVLQLFHSVSSDGGIAGVVHSAGVLVDGNIRTQDVERLRAVWPGKVQGAVNLHVASVRQVEQGGPPLRLFLLYSSSAALFGSAAGSNYAAANSMLDNLAILRRQEGLACTSIQWGPWNAVGFAKPAFIDALAKAGFGHITNAAGALVLNTLLNRPALSQPPVFSFLPLHWARFAENGPAFNLRTDMSCFEAVKHRVVPKPTAAPMTPDLRAYSELEGPEQRAAMVERVVLQAVRDVTGQDVQAEDNLMERGIASLEAFELVETLRLRFPIQMDIYRLLEFPSVASLLPFLTTQLDKLINANRSMPLTRGQQLALANSLHHSFLFVRLDELGRQGGLSPQALLRAWGRLVTRYAVLRTVIEPASQDSTLLDPTPQSSLRQRVLPAGEVSVSDMFATLPATGPAHDLGGIQAAMDQATITMGSVPPARVFLSMGPSPRALLAVSRLLVDRWSLQVLAGEMAVLYTHAVERPGLMPQLHTRPAFIEEMQRLASESPSPEAEVSTPAPLPPMEECKVEEDQASPPPALVNVGPKKSSLSSLICEDEAPGLPRNGSTILKSVCQPSTLELSPRLSSALNTHSVKAGVGPWVLLLSAYLEALLDYADESKLTCVVDLDTPVSHTEALGPHCVPFPLTVTRAQALSSRFLRTVHGLSSAALADLHLPSSEFARNAETQGPIGRGLPGFAYRDESGRVHSVGPSALQAIQLTATARVASDGRATTYALRFEAGAGYSVRGCEAFVEKVHANLKELLQPDGLLVSRSREATPTKPTPSPTGPSFMHRALPLPLATCLQVVGMAAIGLALTLPLPVVWPLLQSVLSHYGRWAALACVPAAYHLMGLLTCGLIIGLRELTFFLARPEIGRCAVNSPSYLAWWFASRLASAAHPVYMDHMRGTFIYPLWLRALGAHIGRGVRLHRHVVLTDPELTVIHDDAVLGKCRLVGSIVRDGVLTRGTVIVGEHAHVGSHAVMQPGSRLAEGAALRPLSVTTEGQALLPAKGVFEGAPATFVHPRSNFVARPSHDAHASPPQALTRLLSLLQTLWGPCMAAAAAGIIFPPVAGLLQRCHVLHYPEWAAFSEGALLCALYGSVGLVPMLSAPLVKAFWDKHHLAEAAQLIDDGLPAASARLFSLRSGMSGVSDVLTLLLAVGLALLLHGLVVTGMSTVSYFLLMGPTEGTAPRRVGGIKEKLRDLKVTVLQWAYTHSMCLFVGTALLPAWYRLLGAKIGRRVLMSHTDVIEDPHLVSLGAGAALIDHASLDTHAEPGDGYAYTGPITVGPQCIVGTRAVLSAGCVLQRGSIVMPHTYLPPNTTVEEDVALCGVPPTRAGTRATIMPDSDSTTPAEPTTPLCVLSTALRWVLAGLLAPMVSCLICILLPLVAQLPALALLSWATGEDKLTIPQAVGLLPVAYVGFMLCLAALVAAHKWALRGRQRASGAVPLYGLGYHVRTHALVLQAYASQAVLDSLRGSLLAPLYLRLLGAVVSCSAYIGTLEVSEPDLLRVGKQASLEPEAIIMTNALEGKSLRMGRARVDASARLGHMSTMHRNTILGVGAELAAGGYLPATFHLRPRATRYGAYIAQTTATDVESGKPEGAESTVMVTMKV